MKRRGSTHIPAHVPEPPIYHLTNSNNILEILPNLPFPNPSGLFVPLEVPTPPTSTFIIIIGPSTICHTDTANLITNLHPALTARRNRADFTQCPICHTSHNETTEEIQVIDISSPGRYRLADSAHEPDDVDEDTTDIGRVAAPVEAEGKVIGGRILGRVEVPDLEVAAADNVVVANYDAGDRREEDRVGGQVSREVVRGGEKIPIQH